MSRIHEALKKQPKIEPHNRQQPLRPIWWTALRRSIATSSLPTIRYARKRCALGRLDPRFKDTGVLTYEELVKRCSHPKWTLDARNSVFVGADSDRVGAERFRTLRSRLYQIAGAQQLKKLLITSSIPAEGKTFVAANLAQSIVRQPDRRVLLIDADLRASRLHQTLGAPSGPGLSDYLRGEVDEYAVIQNGLEGNLCFIPGGQQIANPSELLLRDRMKTLLDRMAEIFDWVISIHPRHCRFTTPACWPINATGFCSSSGREARIRRLPSGCQGNSGTRICWEWCSIASIQPTHTAVIITMAEMRKELRQGSNSGVWHRRNTLVAGLHCFCGTFDRSESARILAALQ